MIHGADRIARFLLGVARKQAGRFADQIAIINSEPGVVRRLDGQISATISIALEPEGISAVYVVLNPDKLRRIAGSGAPAGSGTRP